MLPGTIEQARAVMFQPRRDESNRLITLLIRSQKLDPLFSSFRNSALKLSDGLRALSYITTFICVVFTENQNQHVVFAPLMRCQVIYL